MYWFILIVLVTIATFRPISSTPDSWAYEELFNDLDSPIALLLEPTFHIIARFVHLFSDDVHLLFLVYALIAVSLKMYVFRHSDFFVFLPLLIYVSNYYILHDLIQIRAGVASGFFLMAIKPLAEGQKKKVVKLFICSILFHYSAIALLPLLLINNDNLSKNWKRLLLLTVPFGYFIYFLHIDIFSLIPIPFFQEKMESKVAARDAGIEADINVFNLVFIVRILVFYYTIRFYGLIKEYNKYISIELKMMAISLFCFPALSSMPVFAFRLSEFYGVVDIFVYSSIFYTIRPAQVAKCIVVTMATSLLAINILYSHLIV